MCARQCMWDSVSRSFPPSCAHMCNVLIATYDTNDDCCDSINECGHNNCHSPKLLCPHIKMSLLAMGSPPIILFSCCFSLHPAVVTLKFINTNIYRTVVVVANSAIIVHGGVISDMTFTIVVTTIIVTIVNDFVIGCQYMHNISEVTAVVTAASFRTDRSSKHAQQHKQYADKNFFSGHMAQSSLQICKCCMQKKNLCYSSSKHAQ